MVTLPGHLCCAGETVSTDSWVERLCNVTSALPHSADVEEAHGFRRTQSAHIDQAADMAASLSRD